MTRLTLPIGSAMNLLGREHSYMNLRRTTARLAVAGVSTALAAGALVAGTDVAATAATVTNTYTCSLPGIYSGDFELTVSGDLPVPQYWAGASVPQDLMTVTADATVPADAAGLLGSLGYTGAHSGDFAFKLGSGSVPVPLAGDFSSDGTTTTWHATGKNTAFTTPKPGTYDALLPSAFTLTATGGQMGDQSLSCVIEAGTQPGAIAQGFKLLRQSSQTTAPKSVKVKKGKPAKLATSVKSTSLGTPVTSGKVVAKEGKKVLGSGKLNRKGQAVIALGKKLKVGKHKVTVSFAGTPSIKGSSTKTTVTVKK